MFGRIDPDILLPGNFLITDKISLLVIALITFSIRYNNYEHMHPTKGSHRYEAKIHRIKGGISNSILIVGDFNILLLIIERKIR